jgi:hypothetical protein
MNNEISDIRNAFEKEIPKIGSKKKCISFTSSKSSLTQRGIGVPQ